MDKPPENSEAVTVSNPEGLVSLLEDDNSTEALNGKVSDNDSQAELRSLKPSEESEASSCGDLRKSRPTSDHPRGRSRVVQERCSHGSQVQDCPLE